MQLKKELISLDHHSFDIIEDYLAHVKELAVEIGRMWEELSEER
jgi:hypothetical protein